VNDYLNIVIEALKQKIKNYDKNSDTYEELQNAIDLLERGINLYNTKHERQY
jgi:ribosome-associated translation inhibitor RaiA